MTYRKAYVITETIPADHWRLGGGIELPEGQIVYEWTGQRHGCGEPDELLVTVTDAMPPFWAVPRANAEELTHLPELDEDGAPTGEALCDTGDGTFPGGLLAVPNAWRANCPRCRGEEDR